MAQGKHPESSPLDELAREVMLRLEARGRAAMVVSFPRAENEPEVIDVRIIATALAPSHPVLVLCGFPRDVERRMLDRKLRRMLAWGFTLMTREQLLKLLAAPTN